MQESHNSPQFAKHRLLRWIEQTCTWLPGKVRGGIRCVLEHGWRYTIRHMLEGLRLRAMRTPMTPMRLNRQLRSPRVIVTLFSSPARIDAVDQTLMTLLRQSLRPDQLILWLAKSAFPAGKRALPKSLLRLTRHGLEIRWCDDACAPRGLSLVRAAYPGDIVVTVDDDLLFHPEMIGRLYDAYQKNPDMIHCHDAVAIRYSPETGMLTQGERAYYPVPSYCNMPRSGFGCLYPPASSWQSAVGRAASSAEEDVLSWLLSLESEIRATVVDNPCVASDAPSGARRTGGWPLRLLDLTQAFASAKEMEARLREEQREMALVELALKTPQAQKDYRYYQALDPALYRAEICLWYQAITQKRLDIDHPKTYNEKLQWMKLYDSTPLKAMLTDKFAMREWVAERIGSAYLVKLLGVWDSADDIDFDSLPEKFVLKATHGSNWVMVVRDKRTLDLPTVRAKLNGWLAVNFAFVTGLELHYRHIPARIIAEEYLENAEGDLFDYKFWCFEGKIHSVMFLSERNTGGLKMSFFDPEWNRIDLSYDYPRHDKPVEKPQKLKEMIALSEQLAAGFPHARIDLYLLNDGQIKLGEITFTSASGACRWNPPEGDRMLGALFALPEATPLPE